MPGSFSTPFSKLSRPRDYNRAGRSAVRFVIRSVSHSQPCPGQTLTEYRPSRQRAVTMANSRVPATHSSLHLLLIITASHSENSRRGSGGAAGLVASQSVWRCRTDRSPHILPSPTSLTVKHAHRLDTTRLQPLTRLGRGGPDPARAPQTRPASLSSPPAGAPASSLAHRLWLA